MEAKELRIGNTINGPYDEPTNVDTVIIHYLTKVEKDYQESMYSPIQLTDNKLIELGFKKRQVGDLIYFSKGILEIRKSNEKEYYYNGQTIIKYVHHLQNLYQALTLKELVRKK